MDAAKHLTDLRSLVKRVAADEAILLNGGRGGKARGHRPFPTALAQLCGGAHQHLNDVISDACLSLHIYTTSDKQTVDRTHGD